MTVAMAATDQKPASKTLVIAGFIGTALFTSIAGGVTTYFVTAANAEHQARLSDRAAQINHFVAVSEALDAHVQKFVHEVNASQTQEATKQAIRANLSDQRSALAKARGLLDQRQQRMADQYVEHLSAADTALKTADAPLDAGDFFRAVVRIIEQRELLYAVLRGQVSPPDAASTHTTDATPEPQPSPP